MALQVDPYERAIERCEQPLQAQAVDALACVFRLEPSWAQRAFASQPLAQAFAQLWASTSQLPSVDEALERCCASGLLSFESASDERRRFLIELSSTVPSVGGQIVYATSYRGVALRLESEPRETIERRRHATLAAPPTHATLVAFAADQGPWQTVERLAREASARLQPYGAPAAERVAWLDSSVGAALSFRDEALRAALRQGPQQPLRDRAIDRLRGSLPRERAAGTNAVLSLIEQHARWELAARSADPLSPALAALVGAPSLRDVANPYTPLVEICAHGYLPRGFVGDALALDAPALRRTALAP